MDRKMFAFRENSSGENKSQGKTIDLKEQLIFPGQILGIFGDKGSGRSELLSSLSDKEGTNTIVFEQKTGTQDKGPIAICPQNDHILPTISVREALQFNAMLTLGNAASITTITNQINRILELMQLEEEREILVQFLPKASRKKLAISCELVANPTLLVLDDPFFGLDHKDFIHSIKILTNITKERAMMTVVATDQCQGLLYSVCDAFIFLHQNKVLFQGHGEQLRDALIEVNSPCPDSFNPAEYLVKLLSEEILNDGYSVGESLRKRHLLSLNSSPCHADEIQVKVISSSPTSFISNHVHGSFQARYTDEEEKVLLQRNGNQQRHPNDTSFYSKLMVLSSRNFHNARRRILFPVAIVQNIYILVLCVLVWWRVERTDATVKDRLGLFFFTTVQWAFFALLDAVLSFPKELKIVEHEIRHGKYNVIEFCLAKSFSEFPLAILQPILYMTVIYWTANLNGVSAFFSSIGVLILDVLAAQSIGVFVGTALRPPWTISVVSLGLLSMMLWGGAFNSPPRWLSWGKYASYFYYGLNSFIILEFQKAEPIICTKEAPFCTLRHSVTNETMFSSEMVLTQLEITQPLWCYWIVLFLLYLATRILWGVILARKTRKS